MITQQRKSKYKHKVTFKGGHKDVPHHQINEWCERTFGPGGRSKKLRWRRGWTDKDDTFYFKSDKDAMLFAMKWSS
jgi:hypothetical protein